MKEEPFYDEDLYGPRKRDALGNVTVTPDIITEQGTVCGKCGLLLQGDQWPFCPHPSAGSPMIIGDEIPGGIVVENYGPHPIRFDSYSAMETYRKANGLQLKEKFCPMPGTDIDPQGIPNPAGYMDPQTLENGKILMLRQQGAPAEEEWDARKSGLLVGEFNIVGTDRDAKAFASGDPRRQARIGRRTDVR